VASRGASDDLVSRLAELAAGPALDRAAAEKLLHAAARVYSNTVSPSGAAPESGGVDELTATDVAVAVTHLLDVAGMDLFEIGLWRSWGTR
jgi:hypothetical protein